MFPVKTNESNFTFLGPTPEIADLPCRTEPTVVGGTATYSVWALDEQERGIIAGGGNVRLGIWSFPIPPVSLEIVPNVGPTQRVATPCDVCGKEVDDQVHATGPGTHAYRCGKASAVPVAKPEKTLEEIRATPHNGKVFQADDVDYLLALAAKGKTVVNAAWLRGLAAFVRNTLDRLAEVEKRAEEAEAKVERILRLAVDDGSLRGMKIEYRESDNRLYAYDSNGKHLFSGEATFAVWYLVRRNEMLKAAESRLAEVEKREGELREALTQIRDTPAHCGPAAAWFASVDIARSALSPSSPPTLKTTETGAGGEAKVVFMQCCHGRIVRAHPLYPGSTVPRCGDCGKIVNT